MSLTVGSLFSGIGGLELGLEWAGMEVIWQVEFAGYPTRILEQHWPDVQRYGDITKIDKEELEHVDVICGGFPCQPFSVAGKRKGTEDDRWLWPEFRETVRTVKPRWVLVENVPELLTIDSGRVFGEILRDLSQMGYDAWWGCFRASDVGAPHRRERLFIVAHPSSLGRQQGTDQHGADREQQVREDIEHNRDQVRGDPDRSSQDVADPKGEQGATQHVRKPRSEEQGQPRGGRGEGDVPDTDDSAPPRHGEHGGQVHRVPTSEEPPPRSGQGGWTVEPDVGRVAHGVPARMDRLSALGNAVVPQVTEYIGRCIIAAEEMA